MNIAELFEVRPAAELEDLKESNYPTSIWGATVASYLKVYLDNLTDDDIETKFNDYVLLSTEPIESIVETLTKEHNELLTALYDSQTMSNEEIISRVLYENCNVKVTSLSSLVETSYNTIEDEKEEIIVGVKPEVIATLPNNDLNQIKDTVQELRDKLREQGKIIKIMSENIAKIAFQPQEPSPPNPKMEAQEYEEIVQEILDSYGNNDLNTLSNIFYDFLDIFIESIDTCKENKDKHFSDIVIDSLVGKYKL